ncbi:MAG: thymidine kinase, partial [Lachnospiraceae bacterium]|nr:thymidine kinase [Lachnospiraceae bacterium]
MAKLYFYYGAMNSSKTANALMTHFNYEEVGQKALLCKTEADTRDGARLIRSRIGLEKECILLSELTQMSDTEIKAYNCIIVDEVQFATKEQIDFLSDIVDFMDVPVVCYGLRADFQNKLFTGSERLIAIADT